MKRSIRKQAARRRKTPFQRLELERARFKALILGNPNYFGSLPDSGFKVVKVLAQSTAYEELTCLGLHPETDRLEGVVRIKQHSGYGSDACHAGSTEYVRFYVERPGGWRDLGVTSFTAHDLAAASPLPVSYSVGIDLDEARRYCTVENVVRVRAILSWEWEPPADLPSWVPPWGNVVESRVQVRPWRLPELSVEQLVLDKQIVIDPGLIDTVDLQQTLSTVEPDLSFAQLQEKYAGADVPGHRSGFKEALQMLKGPLAVAVARPARGAATRKARAAALAAAASPDNLTSIPPGAQLAGILESLLATSGDTSYESLDCAGYDPETRKLSAVLTVKRPCGYRGDLCHAGSIEYVGFWLNEGGAWRHMGTAQVRAHDLAAATPGNPLRYAVHRFANLPEMPCGDVRGLRLRAILSWEQEPTGPDFVPVWGNVVETHVQPVLASGPADGLQRVRLMRINGVTVHGISDAGANQGLANPTGVAQDCNTAVYGVPIHDAPFGGTVYIEGDFTLKSDAHFNPVDGSILPGAHPPAYQVWVQKVGAAAAATQITNSFGIAVFPATPPPGPPSHTVTQSVVPIGSAEYYLYREGTVQAVNPRTLAVWNAGGLDEGLYRIEVIGFGWDGVAYVPLATGSQVKDVYLYNGYPHTELVAAGSSVVSVTTRRPSLHLTVNPPHAECGDVQVGDTLAGTYSVQDNFFGSLALRVLPVTVGGVVHPANPVSPSGLIFSPPAVGTHGIGGTWTLDTTGMIPCGYSLVLSSWDRALVGGTCTGHYNQIQVGFCLREKD